MATYGKPMTICRPKKEKMVSREQLARDLEEFLASGGKIKQLPSFVQRDDDMDWSGYRERNEKRAKGSKGRQESTGDC